MFTLTSAFTIAKEFLKLAGILIILFAVMIGFQFAEYVLSKMQDTEYTPPKPIQDVYNGVYEHNDINVGESE